MAKKVLAIVGSPRIGGNTDLLTDAFIKGAKEGGHIITKIHLGTIKVNGCLACGKCYKNGRTCVQDDDMEQIYSAFDAADVVVWASPLYYRQFSAQMKSVIDRMRTLGNPSILSVPHKECALLMAGSSNDEKYYAPPIEFYNFSMINYLKWNDLGTVLALGVTDPGDVKNTDALRRAYNLGKSV